MELIDLIEPCAAKSCEVIGLQGTERNGTFELVASVYRVGFCGEFAARSTEEKCNMGLDW